VERLDAEQNEIDGPKACGVRGGHDRDGRLAFGCAHGEAAGLHRLQMCATRDERDVVSGICDACSIVATDPPGAEHRDPHRLSPCTFGWPARHGRFADSRRSRYSTCVIEVAIAIAGLALSVLTYFAGVRRGRRYRAEDLAAAAEHEADHRIDRVVQRY